MKQRSRRSFSFLALKGVIIFQGSELIVTMSCHTSNGRNPHGFCNHGVPFPSLHGWVRWFRWKILMMEAFSRTIRSQVSTLRFAVESHETGCIREDDVSHGKMTPCRCQHAKISLKAWTLYPKKGFLQ